MKKLMILGASYSQLPLYKKAHEMGLATIAVSTPGDWPGFKQADECSYTDITDPVKVLEAARKLGADGITTCCLDAGVRAIGYTCERLGLKGLSEKAADISNDKFKMKKAFMHGGVSCARHVCIRSREELENALEDFNYPVVVKAVDLMGSRGIFRCNNRDEALHYYQKAMEATKKEYCLLEEFIEGKILGCEAMIADGKMLYCLPNNIEAFQSYVPTPVGHSVPYRKQAELGEEVKRQVVLAAEAVGLDNCPVHCDLIEKNGRIYVIEITGRAGGTCLPEMVSLYYGIDYYEAIIRLAMGMPVAEMFDEKKPHTANLSRTLLSERDGIVASIHNGNLPSDDIVDLSFNIEPGEEVHRYTNGRDRLGQVIITGESLSACEARIREILSKINIEFTV